VSGCFAFWDLIHYCQGDIVKVDTEDVWLDDGSEYAPYYVFFGDLVSRY
jgi:hypothetical protein